MVREEISQNHSAPNMLHPSKTLRAQYLESECLNSKPTSAIYFLNDFEVVI